MNKKIVLVVSLLMFMVVGMGVVSATPPTPCTFSGTVTLDDGPAPVGTVVTAYDSDGVTIGTWVTLYEGGYGYMSTSGDDPETPGDEGAGNGDEIIFYVDGYLAGIVSGSDNIWVASGNKVVNLRATSGEDVPEFSLIMVPFMLSLMIYGMSRRRIGL